MNKLQTTFATLKLKSPVIVASSGLTANIKKIKAFSDAGAGAIVLKSLFEEQINYEAEHYISENDHSEANDYLSEYIKSHKLTEYIQLIKDSKEQCECPIIASINCYSNNSWTNFAAEIEKAGADAIEINILALQTEIDYKSDTFEQLHIDILRSIKKTVSIPVIIKLGQNFTNPVKLVHQLYANGANGVVLFNRFFQPDIDLETLTHIAGKVLNNPVQFAETLRWTGIVSAKQNGDIAASGGIAASSSLIKILLAGASAAEICTAFYQHGPEHIIKLNTKLNLFMETKGWTSLDQMIGILNSSNVSDTNTFERTQFLKYFSSHK